MRPPLSPRTDYELRTACALVLQNYKPSDVVYEEEYGDLQEVPRDEQEEAEYEILRSAVERELESPLQPVNTVATRTLRQRTMSGELISERYKRETRPMVERSPQSEEWRHSAGHRRSLLERAEELRSRLYLESQSPTEDMTNHKRSESGPLMLDDVATGRAAVAQSSTAFKSDSTMADRATPQTEDEEFFSTGSTAPTTAGITPAWTSNRTSNGLQPDSANNSTSKFLASDTEWMRQELEKYKKAQEQSKAMADSEEHATASVTADEAGKTKEASVIQAPPPVPPIPARKPVPKPGVESSYNSAAAQRTGSTPSRELSRSGSRRTPRSESRAEMGLLRPESRQADDDPGPQAEPTQYPTATASRSFHRRPLPGTAAPYQSYNVSQAGSRSRSITRQIREYIRPSSRQSRNASADVSRPESRARSIESFASSVSNLAPSVESSNKWRRWRPFNRNRDSTGSDDFNRPESRDSRRGRAGSQDPNMSPPHKGKPAVNLNRELPPLPSLDQWKDVDAVPEPQEADQEHVASMIKRNPSNGRQIPGTADSRAQKHSVDSTASTQPRDSVLIDNTLRIHPKRISSLGAPADLSDYPFADPTSISLPQSPRTASEQKKDLRQNQSIREFPSELDEQMESVFIADASHRPAVPPKDRFTNYSCASPANGTLGRAMSHRVPPVATRRSGTSNTELHSRTISDQQFNFSRKISSEDYSRMHDTRYIRKITDTPPKPPISPSARPAPVEQIEKPKKKWWQPKLKKNRQSWMAL